MRSRMFVSLSVVFAAFILGCGEDDPVVQSPVAGTVVLFLDHEVDGQPLELESSTSSFPYRNAAGNAYNVSDLSYYVSRFRVHQSDGTSFGFDGVHLRDVSSPDPGNRSVTLAGVPAGRYNAVSFTFGLDARLNISGGLDPFGYIEIPWPEDWGGGYHYMMMNGVYDNGATTIPYLVHTGRRYLTADHPLAEPPGPDLVAHHHFFEVFLPVTEFHISGGDTWDVPIIMNVNGWYQEPLFDLRDYFRGGQAESIMIHLDAQAVLMENGMANVFRIGTVAGH